MALIIPHQSSQGIATGNAGSGAEYRSASAFTTPGQENLGRGLQQFAAGLNSLGEVVFNEEIRERNEQLELDLLKDMQAYRAETAAFQDDYTTKFKGENARDADEQAKAFHEQRLSTLREKYGNSSVALKHIENNGVSLANGSIDSMRDYRRKEGEVYKHTVYVGEIADKASILKDLNSTPEAIAQAEQYMRDTTLRFHSGNGRDPKAAMLKVEEVIIGCKQDRWDNYLASLRETDPQMASKLTYEAIHGGKAGGGSDDKAYVPRTVNLPADVAGIVAKEAEAAGIDAGLAMAVCATESAGKENALSSAGARGCMQLMPDTAKELEKRYGIDTSTKEGNIKAGVLYLKELEERYNGNKEHALMAYNWGMGNVDAWLKTGKGAKGQPVPKETLDYVPKILEGDNVSSPSSAGISPEAEKLRETFSPVELEIRHNKNEARLKEVQTIKKQNAKVLLQDSQDFLSYAMHSGKPEDFDRLDGATAQLQNAGLFEEAAEFGQKVSLYKQAQPFLSNNWGSLAEQQQTVDDIFERQRTPQNSASIDDIKKQATIAIQHKVDAFKKDPAAYILSHPVIQAMQNDESMTTDQKIKRSMTIQQEIGQGLGFTPRVFSNAAVQAWDKQFNAEDADAGKRLDMLVGLQNEYGTFASQAFQELGIADSGRIAAQWAIDQPRDGQASARILLGASLVNAQGIPEIAGMSKNDATLEARNSNTVKYLNKLAGIFPSMPQVLAQAKDMEGAATNTVLLGRSNVLDVLDGNYDFVEDTNFMLRVPKGQYKTDALENGLEHILNNLEGYIPEGQDEFITRALKKRSVWVSNIEDKSATLWDPATGKRVMGKDGQAIKIGYAQAIEVWDEKHKKDVEEFEQGIPSIGFSSIY